jgi:hypothetical protein
MGTLPFTATAYFTATETNATWLGNSDTIYCKCVMGNTDFLTVNSNQAFSVVAEELGAGFTAGWQEMKLYRYEAATPA